MEGQVVRKARFRSNYERILDGKGRLSMPTKFREVFRQSGFDDVMITCVDGRCLRVYTLPEWERFEEELFANKSDPRVATIVSAVNSHLVECSLDKQGRIVLPAKSRDKVGIDKEVVLNGSILYAEIWAKDAWEESESERDEVLKDKSILSKYNIL
ncbi:MAG: division/cell wall cluster transcriptional repressor MraZ [Deltaproteobacteria bacterium]|nr:MAG: division/cell wall cluster transcriptional repressor MraZ [Deltaproteobacteria bacterium]